MPKIKAGRISRASLYRAPKGRSQGRSKSKLGKGKRGGGRSGGGGNGVGQGHQGPAT
jgi:hypothetical protein